MFMTWVTWLSLTPSLKPANSYPSVVNEVSIIHSRKNAPYFSQVCRRVFSTGFNDTSKQQFQNLKPENNNMVRFPRRKPRPVLPFKGKHVLEVGMKLESVNSIGKKQHQLSNNALIIQRMKRDRHIVMFRQGWQLRQIRTNKGASIKQERVLQCAEFECNYAPTLLAGSYLVHRMGVGRTAGSRTTRPPILQAQNYREQSVID